MYRGPTPEKKRGEEMMMKVSSYYSVVINITTTYVHFFVLQLIFDSLQSHVLYQNTVYNFIEQTTTPYFLSCVRSDYDI